MSAWPVAEVAGAPRLSQAGELALRARAVVAAQDCALALRRACEAARVRVLRWSLRVGDRRHSAMLVPTSDGFHALVDSLLWDRAEAGENGRRRLRFVLGHELGHTFFYRPGPPPTRASTPDRLEEQFCHRFATSLLVPRAAALAAQVNPHGLHAVAGRYDVSLRVAAWAVARARPSLSVLWLRRAAHPHRGGEEKMRIEWGASLRFLAPGESLKSDLAYLAPGEHATSSQRLRLGGRDEDVELEAWRFESAMMVVVHHDQRDRLEPNGIAQARQHNLTLFA